MGPLSARGVPRFGEQPRTPKGCTNCGKVMGIASKNNTEIHRQKDVSERMRKEDKKNVGETDRQREQQDRMKKEENKSRKVTEKQREQQDKMKKEENKSRKVTEKSDLKRKGDWQILKT